MLVKIKMESHPPRPKLDTKELKRLKKEKKKFKTEKLLKTLGWQFFAFDIEICRINCDGFDFY